MLRRFLLACAVLGITFACCGVIIAQPPTERITLTGPSIPLYKVFSQFLLFAEAAYADGDEAYREYLEFMGVDPDLPIADELAGEHSRILQELNEMSPGTGDIDLDNQIRADREAVLIGEAYGRMLKVVRQGDPVPDRAEQIFYGRLVERLRPAMKVHYINELPDPARLVQRQRDFEAADRKSRGGNNR